MSNMNVNNNPNQNAYLPDTAPIDGLAKPTDAEAAAAAGRIVAALLAGSGVKVSKTDGADGSQIGATFDLPEMEDADMEKALAADLEVLVAYLTMDQDEGQIKLARERLDSLKGRLKSNHDVTMKKLEKAIKEMKKNEQASLAQKIFGWLGVAVALVVAIATTVATVGAGAVGAAAVVAIACSWAGFAVAATSAILSETGVDKKVIDAISASIRKDHPDWDKSTCDALGSAVWGGIFLVAGIGCGIGTGAALKALGDNVIQRLSDIMRGIIASTTILVGVGSIGATIASAVTSYLAGNAQADVTELEAVLQHLQKMIEDNEEDLQKLLQMLSDALSAVLELMNSKTDVLGEINDKMGLNC